MNTRKSSWDFSLILATVAVLFIISLICVAAMFYFKFAGIQQLPAADKIVYMERMNRLVSPFLIALILLLGICVPKRLLPVVWLNRFAMLLAGVGVVVFFWQGMKIALLGVLGASLVLQLVVCALSAAGSQALHFEKNGYWHRLGSSLIHLGVLLFVLDLFFYRHPGLHLALFWVTTGATVSGMLFCFYAPAVAALACKIRKAF
ncbi:MAG: hypothetical protein ACOY32_02420 [Thermodesulfobacteriota bacterium]